MKALVKVMYEDQQAAGTNEFGLHILVRRCVLDQLGWSDDAGPSSRSSSTVTR